MLERIARIVLVPLLSIAVSLAVGMLVLKVTGYPPVETLQKIVHESFKNAYGFGQVLRTTTVFIFTGLAVALAFHAGLFNIGAEGQLYVGAVAIGILGHYLKMVPQGTLDAFPVDLLHPSFMLVGILAGGAWAAIPGTLKAVTGAHEVITTIMMNFIAYYGINYLVRPSPASFAVPATLHTVRIPESLRMPRLSEYFEALEGSQVNGALLIALLAALSVYILLWHTRLGFEIRAVGQNPTAARLAGISPGKIMVIAMFISGGLASLVGVDFVLGLKGYFEENFSAGAGFIGIAVALLANNHPIGVIFTAFLFGVLNYGKVAAGDIPKDIIDIIQAAIIFSMILGTRIFNRMAIRLRKRAQQVAQQRQETEATA